MIIIPNANPSGVVRSERIPGWRKDSVGCDLPLREELKSLGGSFFLDLHEDCDISLEAMYLFDCNNHDMAIATRNMLEGCGVEMAHEVDNWYGAAGSPDGHKNIVPTVGGIIREEADDSIDWYLENNVCGGIVVETPTLWPLGYRSLVHAKVLASLPELWTKFKVSK